MLRSRACLWSRHLSSDLRWVVFQINRQINPFNQQYFRSLNFAGLAPPLSIQKAILAATHRFGVTCAVQMSQHRNSTVIDWQHRIPTDSKPLRAIDLRASYICLSSGDTSYNNLHIRLRRGSTRKGLFQPVFPYINR